LQGTPAMRVTTSAPSAVPGTANTQAEAAMNIQAASARDNATHGAADATTSQRSAMSAQRQPVQPQAAVAVTSSADVPASSGLAPPVIHTAE
jgi:hypothetical protein